MIMPNVWGQGALFAFSGLDGPCCPPECMNGSLLGDLLGVRLRGREEALDLYFSLRYIRDIRYDLVSSDLILAFLTDRGGHEFPLILTFLDQVTVAGLCPPGSLRLRMVDTEETPENCGFYLFREDREEGTVFTLSLREAVPVTPREVETLRDKRLNYYRAFRDRMPEKAEDRQLLLKCISVMRSQVYSPCGMFRQRWTTPDRIPHAMLWLWDSVFHSFGMIHMETELARDALQSVLDTQQSSGMIPHMARPHTVSGITQPPVLAWGILRYLERTGDRDFAARAVPKLRRYLEWNRENRMDAETGLYGWYIREDMPRNRCDESGMDNSPRFDHPRPMGCVDFCTFMVQEMQCMAGILSCLGEDGEDWDRQARDLKERVNRCLWDEESGLYTDLDLRSGEKTLVFSCASFLPLLAGIPTPEMAGKMARALTDPDAFGTPLPLPTIARSHPLYGTDMWRGPVWINMNYMTALGLRAYGMTELADSLILKTVENIRRFYLTDGVVYEMYDPQGLNSPRALYRKGPVVEPYAPEVRYQTIRDYGWTATLCAAMMLENPSLFGIPEA